MPDEYSPQANAVYSIKMHSNITLKIMPHKQTN